MRRSFQFAALTLFLAAMLPVTAKAQFPLPGIDEAPVVRDAPAVTEFAEDEPTLSDSIPSSSDFSAGKPTAKELRQARAQLRSKLRVERLERNLWSGYEPLRPNWNSIPMMSSRYPTRSSVVVPVYIYPW